METLTTLRTAATAVLAALSASGAPALAEGPVKSPVVVELFTSQGCSSCPAANRVLDALTEEPGVIALSYSVDYWDYLGWADSFADPAFTARQRSYAAAMGKRNVYTPQMVIDGSLDRVGSREGAVREAIAERAAATASGPSLDLARASDGGMTVTVGAAATETPAEVWLVSFDPRDQDVAVGAGENRGAIMPHAHVVRGLERIGVWRGEALTLRAAASGALGAAVLVQDEGHGPIRAAAMASAVAVVADATSGHGGSGR